MTPSLQQARIAFVGGGNMASAIIGGLLAKSIPKGSIFVAESNATNRERMMAIGIRTTKSSTEATQNADIVIIAVKPQAARAACSQLSSAWIGREELPLVITVAAGIQTSTYATWFQEDSGRVPSIIRAMPNTPALVGEGASGLFASNIVSEEERALATALLSSVSRVIEWVGVEELLDVVTGISGSGPAYFFAFVEHLTSAGTSLGLSKEQASRLAKQAAFGAGKMLAEAQEEPSQLRRNVTSPNGTTDAALDSFQSDGFQQMVAQAVMASTSRSKELSDG